MRGAGRTARLNGRFHATATGYPYLKRVTQKESWTIRAVRLIGTLRLSNSGNTTGIIGTGPITFEGTGTLRLQSTTATTVNYINVNGAVYRSPRHRPDLYPHAPLLVPTGRLIEARHPVPGRNSRESPRPHREVMRERSQCPKPPSRTPDAASSMNRPYRTGSHTHANNPALGAGLR
jgi:hypothetical protein